MRYMMRLAEYAWNDHERQLKADGLEKIPSPYKVKIVDDLAKRTQLEETLSQLSQANLAEWAILNAERFIQKIDINNTQKKTEIITSTKVVLLKRIDDQATAFELRQAGFLANTLAKEAIS